MPAITIESLNNAQLDVNHIRDIATSPLPTAVDRFGRVKKTMAGAVASIALVNNRGPWAAVARDYALKDVVSESGVWYICVLAHSTTSASVFAVDALTKWRIYQGVTSSDLAEPDATDLIGHQPDDGLPTTVGTQLRRKDSAARLHLLCARMAAGEPVKLAAYGDSTTDGNYTTGWTANPTSGGNAVGNSNHNLTAPNSWPVKLQTCLREMFGNAAIEVWNAGYSGKQLASGWAVDNYDAALTNNPYYGTPDICFIAFGLNDVAGAGSEIDEHATQTRLLCRKLLDAGTLPVLVSCDAIWLVYPNPRDNREVSRQLDNVKRAIAEELGIPFLDVSMAQREWMERNIDGYRWAIEQSDGLHGKDDWHAFKASVAAAFLFRDIFVFDGSAPQQIQMMDSRSNRIITASANTETTNMRQGVSMFQDTEGGEVLATAWVWNRDPNAEFIYRGLNGEGFDSNVFTTPPKIKIKEYIKASVVAEKTPAGAGLQDAVCSLSELPYRIATLPYGLCRIEYIAGADPVSTHWIGAFELWSTVRGSRDYSDCLAVGAYQSVGGPATEVELLPERPDGTNVYGLTAGEYVDIFVDAAIARRAGVVLAHANSWGSSRPYGSKGFLYLLRGFTDVSYIGIGTVQPNGEIAFIVLGTIANLNLSYRAKFRVRLYRSGANRIISVYPGWDVSATAETITLDSTGVVIPLAGAIGGVYFEPESTGLYRQTTIYQMYKRQGLLADDVSAGVAPVPDYPASVKVAGSSTAASVVGSVDGTAEKTLATITLPRLGPNAEIRPQMHFNAPVGSGSAKTYRLRLNGTQIWSGSNVSSAAYSGNPVILNRGATNSQLTTNGLSGAATASHTATAINTSVTTVLTITAQLANAADSATLEAYSINLIQP